MDDQHVPDWKSPSPKEAQLDKALLSHAEGQLRELLEVMVSDKEINLYHSYANVVSVRRLGYNDHGPVHARVTTYNALKIMRLLKEGGVETSLVAEDVATYDDACFGVALGCFLHDVGMSVTRERHEWHSIVLADRIVTRYLDQFYAGDLAKQVVLRSIIHECMVGHMAHDRIHSIEAGVVLVADGTDMTRGRSRIPMNLERDPMVGDMHRYSANSITRVDLGPGTNKPVRLTIQMNDVTGLFQIEEVLMTKVKASPIMPYMEIVAEIAGQESKSYLR